MEDKKRGECVSRFGFVCKCACDLLFWGEGREKAKDVSFFEEVSSTSTIVAADDAPATDDEEAGKKRRKKLQPSRTGGGTVIAGYYPVQDPLLPVGGAISISSGLAPIGPGAQGMMPMWTLGGDAAGASMIPPGALWVLPPPSVAVAPSSQSQIWTFPRAPQIINLTAVRPVSTEARFTTTASGVNVAKAAEVQHSTAPPVAAAGAAKHGGLQRGRRCIHSEVGTCEGWCSPWVGLVRGCGWSRSGCWKPVRKVGSAFRHLSIT
ncbi:hypothetical protein C4D60_Mb08t11290 [Musa balbisiana]|uniref:Uncharacterized protein n=1 Tax=Musa balbisiana TaxID=52838 RepID=A0A4S8K2Z2_MUSBA|nr:hypothetical protein C4D60_Mb08t11290 [Musa balbisiana]